MPDLEQRFAEFRADTAAAAAGPDARELARRAHRRTQRRIIAATVAGAVAIGALVFVRSGHDPAVDRPIAPPSSPAPKPIGSVPLKTLVYGSAAAEPERAGQGERWHVEKEPVGPVQVPICPKDEPDVAGSQTLTPGTEVAHELTRSRGKVATTDIRYEQLLLSVDEQAARTQFAALVTGAQNCRSSATVTNKVERLNIGDEAWLISEDRRRGELDPLKFTSVIVRKGRAIAIYLDVFGPESGMGFTKPMVTVERHKADARTIAGRLCGLRIGC